MKKKLIFAALFFSLLFSTIIQAVPASATTKTITVHCPPADAVYAAGKGGWGYATRFFADTYYEYQGVKHKLTLAGDAEALSASIMYVATWTDRTFLCHYNEGMDTIVLASEALSSKVSRCYFPDGRSECLIANDPQACPMTCEIEGGIFTSFAEKESL